MDGSAELTKAVENAYRVFSGYRLGGRLEVCRCPACVSEEDATRLERTPLRQIPAALLKEYTHSGRGFDVVIGRQIRYFLPRYLELIAADDVPSHDLECCLSRMSDANYPVEWPEDEADAIDQVFVALFRDALLRPVQCADGRIFEGDRAEQVLCMAATAGGEIGKMLAAWDTIAERGADLRLAHMISNTSWQKRWPQQLANPFWYSTPNATRQAEILLRWIGRPQTRARLEARCLAESDPEMASLLSTAEEAMARLLTAGS